VEGCILLCKTIGQERLLVFIWKLRGKAQIAPVIDGGADSPNRLPKSDVMYINHLSLGFRSLAKEGHMDYTPFF
jgi:hypothetical protein